MRPCGRGSGQASTSQQGGGQASFFTLTPQDAQALNAVVSGTIPVYGADALVLFDPGATHSFISPVFSSRVSCRSTRMSNPLSVSTPLSEVLVTNVMFPMCSMRIGDREMMAELILLDVMDFDVILGMDWLSQHYATLDCREKEVIFRMPGEEEFRFRGEICKKPQNLISVITARRLIRRG